MFITLERIIVRHDEITTLNVEQTCSCCGHNEFQQRSALHYINLVLLPLFPTRREFLLECNNCRRETKPLNLVIDAEQPQANRFPQVKIGHYLKSVAGSLIILFTALVLYQQNLQAQKKQLFYKHNPSVGDVYFVNYFHKTGDENQILFPYRMAKIEHIDKDNQLHVKISAMRYSDQGALKQDYSVRRFLFNSFFIENTETWPSTTILDDILVPQVYRPFQSLDDVETLQQGTEFVKKFAKVPQID